MKLAEHLDKLKAFKIIAETGKLNEAALKLHATQPSLTRLIQTLEAAAGSQLLFRSRQGVQLTRTGELLFKFSAMVLKELDALEVQLENPEAPRSGILQIGSYESLAEYLWPHFMVSFQKSAPELKLNIKTSLAHPEKALLDEQLDLLVDAEPRMLGEFTSWKLYEDQFSFYVAKSLGTNLSKEQIETLPLIYHPRAFDHDNKTIQTHMQEKEYFFKEKIELDSFTSAKTFGRLGVGIAVLPKRLAEDALKSKELMPLVVPGFAKTGFGTHGMYVTIKASRADDLRIKFLIKALREHFKK